MKNEKYKHIPKTTSIGDIIPHNKLNLISVQEKANMIKSLRKSIEDLATLDLFFSEIPLTMDQNAFFKQLVNNVRQRSKTLIWTLAGPDEKKIDEKVKKIKNIF